jgi:hypothetical protein
MATTMRATRNYQAPPKTSTRTELRIVRTPTLTERVEKPQLETATALDGLALESGTLAGRALVLDFTSSPRREP